MLTVLPRQVPEIFIWFLFRGLAEALYLMMTGKIISPDEPRDLRSFKENAEGYLEAEGNWDPITHRDIKPTNFVLGGEDLIFPAFKTPKFIDFGLSYRRSQEEDERRRKGVGTPAYMPPVRYLPCPIYICSPS